MLLWCVLGCYLTLELLKSILYLHQRDVGNKNEKKVCGGNEIIVRFISSYPYNCTLRDLGLYREEMLGMLIVVIHSYGFLWSSWPLDYGSQSCWPINPPGRVWVVLSDPRKLANRVWVDLWPDSNLTGQPKLTGLTVVSSRPYRYPASQKDIIDKMVEELLNREIIRPNSGSFSSLIVLVRKKDHSWRMCIDYWRLNNITVNDNFSITIVTELLDEFHRVEVF